MRDRANATTPAARRRRVLIAGGGIAALETLLALRELAPDALDVELISPERELRYRPLGVVEPLHPGRIGHHDLRAIAADQGASLRVDAVSAVEPDRRVVHTDSGARLPYDDLVLALGARRDPAIPGAITFRGGEDAEQIRALHAELRAGAVKRVAFVVPPGVTWAFPLYELAFSTAMVVSEARLTEVELTLVTPADAPLTIFGARASDGVAGLLREASIRLETAAYARSVVRGRVEIAPHGRELGVDRIVAMPRLFGPGLPGVPADPDGFVQTDPDGAVPGLDHVWVIGDAAAFPVKQGGLATQQADAAAAAIARAAGVPLEPEPFRPVLRGILFTGRGPRYLEAEISGGRGDTSTISETPLWSPATKVVGRFLGPYLASRPASPPSPEGSSFPDLSVA